MATTPAFASTPVTGSAATGTVASTTPYTAPSADVTIYTAPSSGARIDEVSIVAQGTNSANVILLYVNNSTTDYLIKAITVPSNTASTTVAPLSQVITFDNLVLPNASYSLRAAITNTDTSGYLITAFGGSF